MNRPEFYYLKKISIDEYAFVKNKKFIPDGILNRQQIAESVGFAFDMSFGEGAHRLYRSGGTYNRTPREVFMNTFQGKISEYALYMYLNERNIQASQVDLRVEGKGRWDSYDIECYKKHIAVKSTKHYGQLLLLETKDWDENGRYIPNLDTDNSIYDSFVLVRIKPSIDDELKNNNDFWTLRKEEMILELNRYEWEYNIAGFITDDDFKYIIEHDYIIKKDQRIGKYKKDGEYKGTKMDADNYYVQAYNMRNNNEFIQRMKKYAEVAKL